MVFRCIVNDIQYLHNGDDAKNVKALDLRNVLLLDLAFDHYIILKEFITHYHPEILN